MAKQEHKQSPTPTQNHYSHYFQSSSSEEMEILNSLLDSLSKLGEMAENTISDYQKTGNYNIEKFAKLYYINEIICNCFLEIINTARDDEHSLSNFLVKEHNLDKDFFTELRATLSHVGYERGIDLFQDPSLMVKNFNLATFYNHNSKALITNYEDIFKPVIKSINILTGKFELLTSKANSDVSKAFYDINKEDFYLPEENIYKQYLYIAYTYLGKLIEQDDIIKTPEKIAKYSLYMHFFAQALNNVIASTKDESLKQEIQDFKVLYKLSERNELAHIKGFPKMWVNLIKKSIAYQDLKNICDKLKIDLIPSIIKLEKKEDSQTKVDNKENESNNNLNIHNQDSSGKKTSKKEKKKKKEKLAEVLKEHEQIIDEENNLFSTLNKGFATNKKETSDKDLKYYEKMFFIVLRRNAENAEDYAIKFFNYYKDKIDINKQNIYGYTPLFCTSANNWVKLSKLLIDRKADINKVDKEGTTPLFMAAQEGLVEVVDLLLKQKNIDVERGIPLGIAVKNRHAEVVKLLLTKEINLNPVDNTDKTPLFVAALYGYEEIVELLLAKEGINFNQADDLGASPLFIATNNKHTNVMKLLLGKKNILINKSTKEGITPLLIAVSNTDCSNPAKKDIAIIKLLLAHKNIKINLDDNTGLIPMLKHYASIDPDLSKLLTLKIQQGIDKETNKLSTETHEAPYSPITTDPLEIGGDIGGDNTGEQ